MDVFVMLYEYKLIESVVKQPISCPCVPIHMAHWWPVWTVNSAMSTVVPQLRKLPQPAEGSVGQCKMPPIQGTEEKTSTKPEIDFKIPFETFAQKDL